MIKINELRKGSWVDTVGGPQQVDQIYGYSVLLTDGDERPIDQIFPIALTTEILEKCEFEKDEREDIDGDNFIVWYKGFDIHQHESGNFSFAVYIRGDGSFKGGFSIQTLHQLQNLYQSLAMKELTINL